MVLGPESTLCSALKDGCDTGPDRSAADQAKEV